MKPPEEQLKQLIRGTVEVYSTDDLTAKLRKGTPLTVKLGVDPTAADLHLGFTIVMRKLRQFQDLGHNAVLIIGDYTGMIGDPSGRDKTRPSLQPETIRKNTERYLEQAAHVLDIATLKVVYNGEWFETLSFRDVIDLASKLTVARILERDMFEKRYKAGIPIHLHEFLYPMMQAYDSVMLKADVELGGTDQTFNLLAGREMQRDYGQEPQVCITTPLLVGLDGTQKMSKSYGNIIGIEDSPEQMYGKVMSIPDTLMHDYFTLLTDLPTDRIDHWCSEAVHPRDAKAYLAAQITAQYHGDEGATAGATHFDTVFRDKGQPTEMPEVAVEAEALTDGKIRVIQLISLCGFAKSNRDARALVAQGGVTYDGEKVTDPQAELEVRAGAVLKVGKRNFARIQA